MEFVQRLLGTFVNLSTQVYQKMERTIPGFNAIMDKVNAESAARERRRKERREAEKRKEARERYGGVGYDP